MLSFLHALEPRQIKNREYIMLENEEVEEMYFIV